jgi:HK97 family phage major capsid protein
MNIKHLRQRKADALAKAKAIFAVADGRDMTEAERTEYDAVMASVETLNGDILRVEKLMDEERTASTVPAASVSVHNNAADRPWASFGEQLMAVRDAARFNGRNTDVRLQAALGSNEAVDAEGGFLVNPSFAPGLWQRTYDTGMVTNLCTSMEMSSNRIIMNAVDEDSRVNGSRWGGIQAFWQYEASQYTATKPKFRQMQLTANKLIGLCYATDEILEDQTALQSYISQAFPDEFAFKIDDAVINGPGAGAPLGVLNSGAVIVQAKDSAQAANTVSTNNILNMWNRLNVRSRGSSVWFVGSNVEPQLYNLTVGTGTAVKLIYFPPDGNSPYGSLLGRPVMPIEQASPLSSQGDIMLFDMKSYLLGKKGGMKADSSIHVAFLTGEQAFRFTLRLDGQPFWKSPLTPYKGTTTVSPFVTLQAR